MLLASNADLMVRLTRIYTRGGDKGETSLGDGRRVRSRRCGSRPTARSTRPMPRSGWRGCMSVRRRMPMPTRCWRASRTICSISAPISARRKTASRRRDGALRIVAAQVERLEREIDADECRAQAARTRSSCRAARRRRPICIWRARSCRRAERLVCALAAEERVNPEAVKYLNRLSDHLFVLGRRLNDNGAKDVLWQPGMTR